MRNREIRWSLLFIGLLVFMPLGNAAERRELPEFLELGSYSEDSKHAVAELLSDFKESWANQDVEAHMSLFADDAEWLNAYARMFRGKEELAIFLEDRLFTNFDASVSREEMENAILISIRHLGDEAAVIHIATDGRRGPSAIPGELTRRTHIHLTVKKQNDRWLIVHTAIMDARS